MKYNKVLLIVELFSTGHRFSSYIRAFLENYNGNYDHVFILTLKSALLSDSFSETVWRSDSRLSVIPISINLDRSSSFHKIKLLSVWFKLRSAFLFIKSLTNSPIDIVLPSFDSLYIPFAIFGSPFGSTSFSVILLKGFHHIPLSKILRRLSLRFFIIRSLSHTSLTRCFLVDDDIKASLPASIIAKCNSLPDFGDLMTPLPSTDDSLLSLGLPRSELFTILIYGSLDKRKGLQYLLKAATLDSSFRIIVAGRHSPFVRSLLDSPFAQQLIASKRLFSFDSYIDFNAEACLFASTDSIWLGYSHDFYGSSGVLYQACHAGKPVLSTSHGLIGQIVFDNNIGFTFDPLVPKNIVEAIHKLSENQIHPPDLLRNLKHLSLQHNSLAFANHVFSHL